MENKISISLRRLAGGQVVIEIRNESGEVAETRTFGKFSAEAYEILLSLIRREFPGTPVIAADISGN